MRKFRLVIKTTSPYIVALILGFILLPLAVRSAYIQRGYFAAGGELLLPLLFVLLVALKSEIKEVVNEIKGAWM